MEGNRFCSICVKTQATTFCICTASPVLLCDGHLAEHLVKDRSRVHQLLPIGAVSQPTTPGYCERLKARQDGLVLGKDVLMENVQRLDTCIEEFAGKIQAVMNCLSEYWTERNAFLLKTREELVFAIMEATQEAEASVYQDSPELHSPLAAALREAVQDKGPLQLFEYSLDEAAYPASLESLLVVRNGLVRADSPVLPIIMNSQLILYNLREGTKQVEITHPSLAFNDEASICQVSPQLFLVMHLHNVWLLDVELKQAMLKQHSLKSRAWAGLGRYGCFVYAFGGRGEKSAERYDVAMNKWTPLPDMQQERCKFNPALYGESAYLIDTCGTTGVPCVCQLCHEESGYANRPLQQHFPGLVQPQTQTFHCEVFAFLSQQFICLNVALSGTGLASRSVAFVSEGELLVFTETGDWRSWKLGSEETVFAVPQVKLQDSAFRSTKGQYDSYQPVNAVSSSPVTYGGRLFWLNRTIGQVTSYDVLTREVSYKAL